MCADSPRQRTWITVSFGLCWQFYILWRHKRAFKTSQTHYSTRQKLAAAAPAGALLQHAHTGDARNIYRQAHLRHASGHDRRPPLITMPFL